MREIITFGDGPVCPFFFEPRTSTDNLFQLTVGGTGTTVMGNVIVGMVVMMGRLWKVEGGGLDGVGIPTRTGRLLILTTGFYFTNSYGGVYQSCYIRHRRRRCA